VAGPQRSDPIARSPFGARKFVMTGAVFVLAINMSIATTMAIAFFAVGYLDTRNRAANWFGVAFMLAALSFAGEYVLHAGLSDAGARLFIALTMLGCLLAIGRGLARRYELDFPPLGFAAIFLAAALLYFLILDLPRADVTRQILYQAPYFLATLLGVLLVLRARRRGVLDFILLVVLILIALSFASKPLIAYFTGGVGAVPQDYATTLYALISQTSGAVAALLLAMACLALVISDAANSLVRTAQRDAATGLLNLAGFEAHGTRLIAEVPRDTGHSVAMALISLEPPTGVADGDMLSRRLGDALIGIFGPEAQIARIAGLSFAVTMPQTNLFGARRQAEMLRTRLAARTLPVPPDSSAAIGIAEHEPGDSLSDIMGRAQWALDEARRSGGNCVRLAARSALSAGYGGGYSA
jgi:GGDEF domain-containing protein